LSRTGRPLGKKTPYIIKLYNKDFEAWSQIRKLAEREGKSLSDFIVDVIKEYLKRHMPGNPQTPLDIFNEKHVIIKVNDDQATFKIASSSEVKENLMQKSTEELLKMYKAMTERGEYSGRRLYVKWILAKRGVKV